MAESCGPLGAERLFAGVFAEAKNTTKAFSDVSRNPVGDKPQYVDTKDIFEPEYDASARGVTYGSSFGIDMALSRLLRKYIVDHSLDVLGSLRSPETHPSKPPSISVAPPQTPAQTILSQSTSRDYTMNEQFRLFPDDNGCLKPVQRNGSSVPVAVQQPRYSEKLQQGIIQELEKKCRESKAALDEYTARLTMALDGASKETRKKRVVRDFEVALHRAKSVKGAESLVEFLEDCVAVHSKVQDTDKE